jgi:glycosyltransferase involved in cell wall biosynthesis
MKILFLTYSTDITGADLSMLGLAQSVQMQNEILVLSDGPIIDLARSRGLRIRKIARHGGLLSLSSSSSSVNRLLSLWQLPLIAREISHIARDYDVIYVHAKKAVLFAGIASLLSGTGMVWHQRDIVQPSGKTSARTRLSEWVLVTTLNRFSRKIFSVSQAAANTFIAAGGRPTLPAVILNGIDPGDFSKPVVTGLLRTELAIPPHATLIGCFGQLLPWKGHAVLLDAIAGLSNVHLVIVGSAGSANPTYESDLRNKAQQLGIAERVHFTGRREDVPDLMRSVDVIVHPSTEFDPCPRVVIEALHSGTPLVATDVGGVPELVRQEVHGLLVPPSDSAALALAIIRLLEDVPFAKTLSRAGREHAAQCLTLSRVVADVERELLALSSR